MSIDLLVTYISDCDRQTDIQTDGRTDEVFEFMDEVLISTILDWNPQKKLLRTSNENTIKLMKRHNIGINVMGHSV